MDMERRVYVERTTARSAVLRWCLEILVILRLFSVVCRVNLWRWRAGWMWSEPQLDELSSGGVLRVLVILWLFYLLCRVNWWTWRAGWMWSEPQQDQLFSGGMVLGEFCHPMVIFRCMYDKLVNMESRVDVERTTARSAVFK